jgi:hypothetical protein
LIIILDAAGTLIDLDGAFLQGQLRQKISERERQQALKVVFVLVKLPISKDKTRRCIFYYIENVPFLIEQAIREAIVVGKQKHLIDFLNDSNKYIFVPGADRGGGDFIMMVLYANRQDENSGSTAYLLLLQRKQQKTT